MLHAYFRECNQNYNPAILVTSAGAKRSGTIVNKTLTLRAVPGWSNPPVTRAVQEPSLRGSVTVNSHLVQVPFVPGSFR